MNTHKNPPGDYTPSIPPPDPNTKTPKFKLPPKSTDAHCHIFGPGDPMIPLVVDLVRSGGAPFMMGDGRNENDYV